MSRLSAWLRKLRKSRSRSDVTGSEATPPPYITVGRSTYLIGPRPFEFTSARSPVSIGNFCSISRDVVFLSDASHHTELATTFPLEGLCAANDVPQRPSKGPIVVGHDVWIGHSVIILSGVTIGNGAVVGAGSVVTKNVEPYCIVAGNPARYIRRRFDEMSSQALESIAWWHWSDEKMKAEAASFKLPIESFIEMHRRSDFRKS